MGLGGRTSGEYERRWDSGVARCGSPTARAWTGFGLGVDRYGRLWFRGPAMACGQLVDLPCRWCGVIVGAS
jgi:hypothetical protein